MDPDDDESLDYIQLIPYDSYPFEKARQRTTIKWLLGKAYNGKIPDDVAEPFYEDDEGLPHLKPPIVKGLSDAELYTLALCNMYGDPNYSQLSPWGVVQLLARKGIFIQGGGGEQITETVLIQRTPLRISPHLSLIEGLQQLYIKETMKMTRIKLLKNLSHELPSDHEEALLLWINETVMAVKEMLRAPPSPSHHPTLHVNTHNLPGATLTNFLTLPPYHDLSDLSDGVALCILLSYYKHLPLSSVIIPTQGESLNVSEALTNLQLFINNLELYCYLVFEDLLYIHKSIRLGLVVLLAELFGVLEGGVKGGNATTGGNFGDMRRWCEVSPMARQQQQQHGMSGGDPIRSLHTTPIKRERKNLHTTIDYVEKNVINPTPVVSVPIYGGGGDRSSGGDRRSGAGSIHGGWSGSGEKSGGLLHGNSTWSEKSVSPQHQMGWGDSDGGGGGGRRSGGSGWSDDGRGKVVSSGRGISSIPPPMHAKSTSSSSDSDSAHPFQVKSRRTIPTLSRLHAAGLPSTNNIKPTTDSAPSRRRISRSNSLTEIDSQLTIEHFGGGNTKDTGTVVREKYAIKGGGGGGGGGGKENRWEVSSTRSDQAHDVEPPEPSKMTPYQRYSAPRDQFAPTTIPIQDQYSTQSRDQYSKPQAREPQQQQQYSSAQQTPYEQYSTPREAYQPRDVPRETFQRDSSPRDYYSTPSPHHFARTRDPELYSQQGRERERTYGQTSQYTRDPVGHPPPQRDSPQYAREPAGHHSTTHRESPQQYSHSRGGEPLSHQSQRDSPQQYSSREPLSHHSSQPDSSQYGRVSELSGHYVHVVRDQQQPQQQQHHFPSNNSDSSTTLLSRLSTDNQQPVNIIYLGGSPVTPAQAQAAQQQQQLIDPEIEETTAEIESLRAKLEEKRMAIEKLRMKRVMAQGAVKSGSSGSVAAQQQQQQQPAPPAYAQPITTHSFHLHEPENMSPQQPAQHEKEFITLGSTTVVDIVPPTAAAGEQQPPPVPPPRVKRSSTIPAPSATDMSPQSISFIHETPKITSGTKTYRISTPDTSLSSSGGGGAGGGASLRNVFGSMGGGGGGGGGGSSAGFYIDLKEEQPKDPRQEITVSIATIGQQQLPTADHYYGHNQQEPRDLTDYVQSLSSQSPTRDMSHGPPVFQIPMSTTSNAAASQNNDLLERKKQRILLQSLKRQQEVEEQRRRKEDEMERRREEEMIRLEEKMKKKEEEKLRREKILEDYRLKKEVEEGEPPSRVVEPPPSRWDVKRRPRSSPAVGKPRPKTMHAGPDNSLPWQQQLQRNENSQSNSSVNKIAPPSTFRPSRSRVNSGSVHHDPWGSTTSLTSQQSKYGRFGRRSLSQNRIGQQAPEPPSRFRYTAGSTSSLVDVNFPPKTSGVGGDGVDASRPSPPPAARPTQLYTHVQQSQPPVLHSPAAGPQQQQQKPWPGSLPIHHRGGRFDDQSSELDFAGGHHSTATSYRPPPSKSNRSLILNAVEYSIFPGVVNAEAKRRVLDEIQRSEAHSFLIMFRDSGCQFRALYEITDSEEIIKVYGIGPRVINDDMFDKFFKYNSGGKCFTPVHTRHLTVTIDAFTIQNSLWQRKKI